jgi:hypothetical protein
MWKEAAMSIAEIIPAVRALSRGEKFQLAQLLLEDLASEELPAMFKEGQVFPIYTPEYAPDAAAQLAQLLKEEGTRSCALSSSFPTATGTRLPGGWT